MPFPGCLSAQACVCPDHLRGGDRDVSFPPLQSVTRSKCSKNTSAVGASLGMLRMLFGPEPRPSKRAELRPWSPVLCLEAKLPPFHQQDICALSAEASGLSVAMLRCFKLTN